MVFILYANFLANPLFEKFEIIPGEADMVQMPLPAEANNLNYDLERIMIAKNALEIQGWAFIDGYSYAADYDHTFVVLKSAKATYVFNATKVWDNVVTNNYGGPYLNLDWSGFTSTIPLRKIDDGIFNIGLCITKDGTTALQYSTKMIIKSNTGVKLIDSAAKTP